VLKLDSIGFIGLGNMGGPIALRLLRAGYPITVVDLVGDRLKPLLAEGATAAASPLEAAERSEVVLASLEAKAVEEVVLGEKGIARSGKRGLVFVDLSSTTPELSVRVSDSLRAQGVEMLDAPVSGADIGAVTGRLTVFVGGKYEAYQRCLPILQWIGDTVTYLGKNGNGQIAKRINQMMQAMCEVSIYEGMLLAEKMGLDPKMFARAAARGCAQSWRLDEMVEQVMQKGERRYRLRIRPGRTGNALQMAQSAGLKLPAAEAAHEEFSRQNWQIILDFDK
jgi:3-hydroxyisobutyrate dehydrogenase-like beta-hydroxyacid dehydrogenase